MGVSNWVHFLIYAFTFFLQHLEIALHFVFHSNMKILQKGIFFFIFKIKGLLQMGIFQRFSKKWVS